MKGKLSLDFDPRIENYSLSLSNSKLRIKAGILKYRLEVGTFETSLDR